MIADIATGHTGLADICFLVALVVFALEFVVLVVGRTAITKGTLPALGLAAVALGWLVL